MELSPEKTASITRHTNGVASLKSIASFNPEVLKYQWPKTILQSGIWHANKLPRPFRYKQCLRLFFVTLHFGIFFLWEVGHLPKVNEPRKADTESSLVK